MITLTSVDVAKVLRELADKIEEGRIHPRQVVLGDSRFEMDFAEVYCFEEARGSGKGS